MPVGGDDPDHLVDHLLRVALVLQVVVEVGPVQQRGGGVPPLEHGLGPGVVVPGPVGAGVDHGDPDAARLQLALHGPGQRLDGVLGGGVDAEPRSGADADRGGHPDDLARAPLQHRRHQVLDEMQVPEDVHLERPADPVHRNLDHRPRLLDTGVEHQDVHPVAPGVRPVGRVGDVELDRVEGHPGAVRLGAQLAYLRPDLGAGDDVVAGPGQPERGAPAEPAAGPGDEDVGHPVSPAAPSAGDPPC
jgi:hypothetical protein